MSSRPALDRRRFLKLGAAAAGALVLGISFSGVNEAIPATEGNADHFAPNAFLRIDADGTITITVPCAEMGQGVLSTLALLVAEELGADWKRVRTAFAPADVRYANPKSGRQTTSGSSSVRNFYQPMREAGAVAREMLIAAAAKRLDVAPPTCRVDLHRVIHGPTDTQLEFGELVADAAAQPLPKKVFLKTPDMFSYIGRPLPRLDTADKVLGRVRFGQDVQMPGLLIAGVERAPAFGARLAGFNAVAAYRVPGVIQVFPIENGVAVVGDSFHAVQRARAALQVKWQMPDAPVDNAVVERRLDAALRKTKSVRREGDPEETLRRLPIVTAEYHLPYEAHACMEPMNCTAHVHADGCELWVGTQAVGAAQQMAAQVTGLAPEQVQVHNLFLGGGFGRRLEQDFVGEAVQISQVARAPIKLMWSREDDLRHDFYRPVSLHRLRARVDPDGDVIAWEHRLACPSILARLAPDPKRKADGTSIEGAVNLPYAIPHLQVSCASVELPVPVGLWRSVGSSHNTFVTECFLDEVAAAAERDPYELRRELLREKPRHRGVLELAAAKAGWGTPLPAGRARGIAVSGSFHSYVAQVAEVSIEGDAVKVHHVVCAIDCGTVVSPDTVRAQMEGSIVYGLTAALKGGITLRDGGVAQQGFSDYPLLRLDETPRIEVHIVPSEEPPGGVGEPGVPPAAPAVANAIFALTGKPVRRLPIQLPSATDQQGATS